MGASVNHRATGTPNLIANKFLLTNEIAIKIPGSSIAGNGAAGNTWCSKMAAPGDFDAVRVVIFHSSTSATTTYASIVSVTETASQTTDVNRWRPVVGGVEYSALNASEGYGWKTVTWSGASSFVSAAGSATVPVATVSDWIPLHSVPRADGGTFPLIHIRTSAIGGTTSYGGNTATGMYTETAANGGFICQSGWGADASGLQVTAPAANNPTGAMSGNIHSFGIQFRTRKPGISVICIGDSLTQNSVVVADLLSSFGLRAAAQISANGTPCGFINAGFASNTLTVASVAGLDLLTKLGANVAMIQGLSPNGPTGFNTDAFIRDSVRKQAALVAEMVSAARTAKAIPIISTGMPMAAGTIPNESQDAYRRAYNDEIRANSMNYLDWDALVSDNATPARIQVALQYDTTHPNEAVVASQGRALAQKLTEIFS